MYFYSFFEPQQTFSYKTFPGKAYRESVNEIAGESITLIQIYSKTVNNLDYNCSIPYFPF